MGIFENTVLVDRKPSLGNLFARYFCIALIIFCVILSFTVLQGILLFPAMIIGIIWYLLKTASKIEYEYTYIEGELAFDKIKAKRKRKKIVKLDMEAVVLIAPSTAHELDTYHNNKSIEVKDCTSREKDAHVYEVIYKSGNGLADIMFEPDEKMIDMIQSRNVRKVLK